MYRAIYAGKKEAIRNPSSSKTHYFTIMLRMISNWIRELQPVAVQIYWDAPRATLWRRKIFTRYKDRDYGNYIADISQELVIVERTARECFKYLNVHQFKRARMEADDLIYAAAKHQCNYPIIIASTDADMTQIPFYFNCAAVYDTESNQLLPRPSISPVLIKALMGDNSDRIPGYHKVGPVTATKLAQSPTELHKFLLSKGNSTFIRNLLLIDLAICPYLLHNVIYISKVLGTPPVFDRAALIAADHKYKIIGMMRDYANLIGSFKSLGIK